MKEFFPKSVYIILFSSVLCLGAYGMNGCKSAQKHKNNTIYVEPNADLSIREGFVSQREQNIRVISNGKKIAIIKLSKPVIVAQADQEEKWGFFQFPNIGKANDGTLVVSWHMRDDSHKAYGKIGRKYTPMMSKDGGATWKPQNKGYFAPARGYNGVMKNGKVLQIVTPASKNIKEYGSFPKPISSKGARSFYKADELPQDLQGAYLQYIDGINVPHTFHADVYDPGLIRNSIGDLMPLVWWGNIIQMSDNSLVAGVYPSRYLTKDGRVTRSSVSFYRSEDKGQSWKILSRIPCEADGILDIRGDDEFDEPTFEVLPDSTYMCVMRSGSTSPMYRIFSYNRGVTWTQPEPFTPNGVNPKLMLLKNCVLVLASGRPGVQLRFSIDGSGKTWTEPIEMLPFSYSPFIKDSAIETTCGYANIIADGKNSFYIVYSDFKAKNAKGEPRKAIMVRRVEVVKAK